MIMVPMRARRFRLLQPAPRWLLVALLAGFTALPAAADEPPQPMSATDYPAVDVHAKEQVAIAAEPCDAAKQCKFFQVDYLKYHFMPIRIIVTNNGDRPISLRDARIYFISAAGDRVQAAEPDDVERRFRPPDAGGLGGIPIGPIHIHPKHGDQDKKVEQDFDRFEYAALAVEPHTTRAGFLFYDMQGLGNDPLRGAKLTLRELRNADGNELFYFEIPFDEYLNAQKQH